MESSQSDSDSDPMEYRTPKKKRYRSSIHHGFSKRTAKYHKVSPDNDNTRRGNTSRLTRPHNQKVTQDDASQGSESDFSQTDEPHDIMQEQEVDQGKMEESSESCSISLTDEEEASSLSDISELNSSSSDDFIMDHSTTDYSDENSDTENSLRDNVAKPLYDGCKLTQYKAYIVIMLFVTKNSLSRDGFEELLQMLSVLLPPSSILTTSVYQLKDTLKKNLGYNEPIQHFYCQNCQQLLKDKNKCLRESCQRENAQVLEFYDLNMTQQLKNFFQDDNFMKAIKKQQRKAENLNEELTDIVQGQRYKEVVPKNNGADINLTLTLNTDGVAIFKSSKKGSLWPVYLAINELPVTLRYSRKYIMPCFLHCHQEKPNMMTYFKPLMMSLTDLYESGITVQTNGGKLLVKAQLLIASLDLPARALVANMKHFNGKFGCSVCLEEGKSRQGMAMLRYYPFNEVIQLRTHKSMVNDVRKVTKEGQEVRGIKGASPLMMLSYIDLPKCLVIDWMHCTLLGVTKYLMSMWFSTKNRDKKYFIGDKIELLDRRYLGIKIPDYISRRQRTLQDLKHWKATEFREWLVHFSVPVLLNILEEETYLHYILFVSAISTFVRDDLKKDDINFAEHCLQDFCKLFPKIYGDYSQTMNLHLIRHLATYVRMYGPLYGYSCFGFESMNSFLKNMVHGTSHINKQISFAICMSKQLSNVVKSLAEDEDTKLKHLFKQLSAKFIQDERQSEEVPCPLGKKTMMTEHHQYYKLLSREMQVGMVKTFNRLNFGGTVFYTKEYQTSKTRKDYLCTYYENDEIKKGTIMLFLEYNGNEYAIIQECLTFPFTLEDKINRKIKNHTLKMYTNSELCRHLESIQDYGDKKLYNCNKILKKCVLIEVYNSKSFISIPPNTLEHN